MARLHGKNAAVFVDGYDYSGITNAVEFSADRPMAGCTVFSSGGEDVLPGKPKFACKYGGFFENGVAAGAGGYDEVMWADLTSEALALLGIYPGGAAAGNNGFEAQAYLGKEPRKASTTAAVTLDVEWEGSKSASRMTVLANGPVTAVGAVVGSNQNVGATVSTETMVVVMRALAVSGAGSVTAQLQQSNDDGAVDPYAQVATIQATFTAAGQSYRNTLTGVTKAWKRINVSAFSGFTSVTLMAVVGKHTT